MSVRALAACLLLMVSSSALHAQRLGEFSLRAGAAIATPADSIVGGTGPALEASYGTRFGPIVVLLEGGYLWVSDLRHVWRYGIGVRGEFGHGGWRPYLVGGLGGYSDTGRRLESIEGQEFVSSLSWFGVNGGAGVRREFGRSPLSLMAESRFHVRMQSAYPDTRVVGLEIISVMLGGVVSW